MNCWSSTSRNLMFLHNLVNEIIRIQKHIFQFSIFYLSLKKSWIFIFFWKNNSTPNVWTLAWGCGLDKGMELNKYTTNKRLSFASRKQISKQNLWNNLKIFKFCFNSPWINMKGQKGYTSSWDDLVKQLIRDWRKL